MIDKLYVRTATLEDLDTLIDWRRKTAKIINEKYGTDQWNYDYPKHILENWINHGETLMFYENLDHAPVATLTLSTQGSDELWGKEELAQPAMYLSKLNVNPELKIPGLGERLIKWSLNKTAEAGIPIVRIDVWTTNKRLRKYYEDYGFQYIRTEPDTVSGALYVIGSRV